MHHLGRVVAATSIFAAACFATSPTFAAGDEGNVGKPVEEPAKVTINDGNYQDTALYRSMTPTDDFIATPSFDYKIIAKPDRRANRQNTILGRAARNTAVPVRPGKNKADAAKGGGQATIPRAIPMGWNRAGISS